MTPSTMKDGLVGCLEGVGMLGKWCKNFAMKTNKKNTELLFRKCDMTEVVQQTELNVVVFISLSKFTKSLKNT